ncbi:gamma-glutamyltransferase family protein [Orrella sp. 11846]|uniref:gamma-glutamyltransferase family protein n=1 Tax=Orrella sp. 11846 TaxID=3409913 RepID=UPI003B593A9D
MDIHSFNSIRRKPVMARNMVASSQPLASQAGANAFARGGNAIDAALAAAIAITVVEPTMNGIGGDAFAILWDGERLHGMNGSGRAPAGWNLERFAGKTAMDTRGWETVTVPGQVAAWADLSDRFGDLPFEDLFEDAIRYAMDGFPVSPVIARQWEMSAQELHVQPGFDAFMPNGRAPKAGEIWRCADQAVTLREIARTHGRSFYEGRLAHHITEFAAIHGAALSMEDLAEHQTEWVEPISQAYGDVRVHEIPPNGQGIAALIALGILSYLPYGETAVGSAARVHLEIEAMRCAFADLYAHITDPNHMRVKPEDLLKPAYLKARAALIDPKKAGVYPAGQPENGGTIYLCAADAQGRMISYIQSNYKGFGSGVVVPGTGIALHSRGNSFSLDPSHPNVVAGRKKTMHTIIPAFMTTADGQPLMAFGVMGANMQAQGHVQMTLRVSVEGLNPQAASDAPRWRIIDSGELIMEAEWPESVLRELRDMGHDLTVEPNNSLEFGSAQLIARLDTQRGETVAYVGGSDARRDGQVSPY